MSAGFETDARLCREIRHVLEREVSANPVSYNKETPYQSYERIGFEGLRWSVEKRIREYGLDKFFDAEATVLDIGSNFGFFVCEFALHCRAAHGIEPNPDLIEIGKITAAYLGIAERVTFYDTLFEDFQAPGAYDTVLSLAAFFTADGRERTSAEKYFTKIKSLLKPGGRVFYESTSYNKEPGHKAYGHFTAAESAIGAIADVMTLEREWETPSGSKNFFRRFAVAKAPAS